MAYLAYITVPDKKLGLTIARALVEARLAAGVNLLPGAFSVYRWQGAVCEAEECLLFAQVSEEALADFCRTVRELHCHKVPCILGLPARDGHEPFIHWIEANSVPLSGVTAM